MKTNDRQDENNDYLRSLRLFTLSNPPMKGHGGFMDKSELANIKIDLFYLATVLEQDGGKEVALELVVELLKKINTFE